MAPQENDIDSLARMVAEGFKDSQKNVNERFDQVDERLDSPEKEVHQISQRIDTVVMPLLDDHSRRIKDLETSVA